MNDPSEAHRGAMMPTPEAARQGCCDDRRKPCEYHAAYADGWEAQEQHVSQLVVDLLDLVQRGDEPMPQTREVSARAKVWLGAHR